VRVRTSLATSRVGLLPVWHKALLYGPSLMLSTLP
jgi:hypothetical protein